MKATIEFPDWIDEDEFEFIGYKEAEKGDYVIHSMQDTSWYVAPWPGETSQLCYLCFGKKQKFEWPERFPDGSILAFSYLDKEWVTIVNSCCRGYGQVILPVSLNADSSEFYLKDLDKSKVYIKGENQ
jgi:hypothetical protein